jgi:uncharacterized protein YaaQ
MAFGVVLFTLLVQGLTMKSFLTRMGLVQKSPAQEEYEGLNARVIMSRTAFNHLKTMYQEGLLSRPVWELLSIPIEHHTNKLLDAAARAVKADPEIESRELEIAITEALNSERAALQDLLRDGKISEDTFSRLLQEVDSAIMDDQSALIHQLKQQSFRDVEDLMTIVLQEKDQLRITTRLESAGYPVTHIASTGGFLGRKNATLMIGVPAGKLTEIKSILESVTKTSLQLDLADQTDKHEKPAAIATIFNLAVERHEEL